MRRCAWCGITLKFSRRLTRRTHCRSCAGARRRMWEGPAHPFHSRRGQKEK